MNGRGNTHSNPVYQRYICPLYDNLSTQKQSSRAIISFYQGKQEVLKLFSSIKYMYFEQMADNKDVTVGRPRRRSAFIVNSESICKVC